ncbi:hypothetical protein CI610_01826 [invertebrate metagenome]|uniref:Uncharacterized protein n=1 Tax=invertebrate metagenome TaxID=1711999 RepID=A0A2H9T7K6_9ZZZZ
MAGSVGPSAIIICESRQARKGATVAETLCAGVWLAGNVSILFCCDFFSFVSFSSLISDTFAFYAEYVVMCSAVRAFFSSLR